MSWQTMAQRAPHVARLGRQLLDLTGIALLATVRPDGGPRLHPVCPRITANELFLVLIDKSPKSRDLHLDRRCVLHAIPGPGHEEFWVEADAIMLSDVQTREWANIDENLKPPVGDSLVRLELRAAHGTIFGSGDDGRPVPHRKHWHRSGPHGTGGVE